MNPFTTHTSNFTFSRLMRLLPSALTVFLLSGCGVRPQTQPETGNTAAQTQPHTFEADTGLSADAENYLTDETQSFHVDHNPLGKIRFCSLVPEDPTASGKDAVFRIEKDGEALQILDDSSTAATMFFSKVEAVSFPDYNNDGYDDIIIINSYDILGGPDTGTGVSLVKYYKSSKSGAFSYDRTLSETASKTLTEFTISTAREYAEKFSTSAPGDANASTDFVLCRQQYQKALNELIENHVFPNGMPADDTFLDESDFTCGDYAVCDIDADGAEELLISYTDAAMAGMVFYIFQYDTATGSFREEFGAFPGVTFYENGYITAEISHNQGMAGDFWPYSIFQYDAATDSYLHVAYIDAWDKNLFPTDYDGAAFPDEADTSNSGFVYYIYRNDAPSDGTQPAPSDVTEYNRLLDETYGNSDTLQIDYLEITKENIKQI